jgi:hypothetical protein
MAAPHGDELIIDWEDNINEILRNKPRVHLEVGGEDNQVNSMTTLHEGLISLEVPHQLEIVPGVGHIWGLLYNEVGIEGLQFHGKCFKEAIPIPPYRHFLPTVRKRYIPD